MFKIEDLLVLFSNDKVKDLLLKSYSLSQTQDRELSTATFTQLFFLKSNFPNIDIIIDENLEKSHFDPSSGIILLKDSSITTFFHEIGHLLSYSYSRFQVPQEYNSFKENFFNSQDTERMIIYFINECERRKEELLDSYKIDISNIINKEEASNNISSNSNNVINNMEDIVDSIYDGRSYTYGITYIKNNQSNAVKSNKTAGHGCNYFSNSNYQFEELLANYFAIKLVDPNSELFIMLKSILGEEFIAFLDQRCMDICGMYSKDISNDYNSKLS